MCFPTKDMVAMADRDISETETDWVANSAYGYGFGYTKGQALIEMMKHVDTDSDVRVTLAEHTGNVRVGPTGMQFEGELVQDEELTIEGGRVEELRNIAIDTIVFDSLTSE